jgi:hypothetical protein
MGGIGSTRWSDHQRAPLVEEAMAIDLRCPKWKTLLGSGRAEGTLYWSDSRSGSAMGWADFLLAPLSSDRTRNLVLDFTGDEFEPKQVVVLRLRPAGFSAHWFAGCRSCDRWVRTLFAIGQSDRFKCRVCAGLTYRTTQAHDARLDFARRDPEGFLASRATAPKTDKSRRVTEWLLAHGLKSYRPGRESGERALASLSRIAARWRQEYIDKWGFPPENCGRIANGG